MVIGIETGIYRNRKNQTIYIKAVAKNEDMGEDFVVYDTENHESFIAPIEMLKECQLLRKVTIGNISVKELQTDSP